MKINKKEKEFEAYKNSLEQWEKEKITEFFQNLKERTASAGVYSKIIKEAYCQAVLFFADMNISTDEILKRLDLRHIGGFYARPMGLWFDLDMVGEYKTAGYIRYGREFCEAVYNNQEEIIPSVLQIAALIAVKKYPLFSCRLKKGFYCYSLEDRKIPPIVKPYEKETAFCMEDGSFYNIGYKDGKIIFSYINGVTDSYGAALFLKAVVENYGYMLSDEFEDGMSRAMLKGAVYSENINGFEGFEIFPEHFSVNETRVISMEGEGKCRVDFCTMSISEVERASASNGVGMKEYLLYAVFLAASDCSDQLKGDIAVGVQYDLRDSHGLSTLRNFTCDISVHMKKEEGINCKDLSKNLNEAEKREEIERQLCRTLLWKKSTAKVPIDFKAYTNLFCQMSEIDKVTCSFGFFDKTQCLPKGDMYFVIRPHCKIGCYATVLENKVVLSVCNKSSDPTFFERVKDVLSGDGIHFFEDRKIMKSAISCLVE